jgi:hypothetical protein
MFFSLATMRNYIANVNCIFVVQLFPFPLGYISPDIYYIYGTASWLCLDSWRVVLQGELCTIVGGWKCYWKKFEIFLLKRNGYFSCYSFLCFRIHNSVLRGRKLFQVRNETLQNAVKTPVAEVGICSNLRR